MRASDGFRIKRLRLGDGAVVVEVAGELDLCSSHTFREHLAGATDSGAAAVVVDLTGISFIDSTGLSVLAVQARRAALDGPALAVVCPEGRVRKVLTMTGLDRVIPVYATRGKAQRSEALA